MFEVKEVTKDIDILKTLNNLWEKSIYQEKTSEDVKDFLKTNITLTQDILKQILPEYKKLLAKDKLTKEEEWELIYIKDAIEYLSFSISMIQSLAAAFITLDPKIKPFFEKILNLYLLLADLTGYYPQADDELINQIEQSLKDKEEGKVRPLVDVLKEL